MTEFPAFPYNPYSIQTDFMNALYHFLDKGGVSMLESPTGTHLSRSLYYNTCMSILLLRVSFISGTGKSLSIICSALQWLIDRKEKAKSDSHKVDGNDGDDEPDWMRNFTVNENDRAPDVNTIKNNSKSPFRLRKHAKQRVPQVFSNPMEGHSDASKEGEDPVRKHEAELNDQEFLLEEYESQEDSSPKSKRKPAGGFDSSSEDEEDEKECSDDEQGLKVFFCSRTHSQLSQFVKELRKTVFAQNIKVVCLGSRKNLCINEGIPPFLLPVFLSLPDTYSYRGHVQMFLSLEMWLESTRGAWSCKRRRNLKSLKRRYTLSTCLMDLSCIAGSV